MRPLFFLFPFVVAVIVGTGASDTSDDLLSHDDIQLINNEVGGTWKAGKSDRFRTVNEVRKVLGARREHPMLKNQRRPTVTHEDVVLNLPKSFDAREKWPECETIKQIRDQSSCGSCWAFAAVTAMSDRVCIHSNRTMTNVQLSPTDLMSCCKTCGYGCRGGWIGVPWDFWRDEGIVTGGLYGDETTCRPYPFAPCDHHAEKEKYGPCPKKLYATPKCESQCQEKFQEKTFDEDKIYALNSYNLLQNQVTIQKEIWINGPVEAAMNVYADFGAYKEGIYEHKSGELLGGHAVRILGWGADDKNTPYWLIANSWNEQWGEKGLFRILRGSDHCGIESDVAAGIPKLYINNDSN